ncbi:UNVERIFIED_ORG: putative ATP-dependent endonuclease of OLD family [Idiomarina abyssalis]|uniref:ATP-dependent nuclease n=1 Tax=Idiomarina sp. 017G TaxID=2183988 RepID=UPI000E0EE53B|nr:AAA family ATPase [Idiomarina sp. 017G]TDO51875.1 putative ATP-dependent endonuclease of OLD family [Idiomarina sp. 017G]
MKLSKVEIDNFRGIRETKINFENFTTLVGPNNIGKSTVLAALNLVLDNKKPTLDDWPNRDPNGDLMRITCRFEELEDWEKRRPSISKLLYRDSLIVRMEASCNAETLKVETEYSVYCEYTNYPWVELKWADFKSHDLFGELSEHFGKSKKDFFSDISKVEEYMDTYHADKCPTVADWVEKGFPNSLQQAVPHVMYVPATFTIDEELRNTNKTSPFAILFNETLFPSIKKNDCFEDYKKVADELNRRVKGEGEDGPIPELDDTLSKLSDSINEVLDFSSSVRLELGDIKIEESFLKASKLIINEEIDTDLIYQGSGVQRALAYALLESNAYQLAKRGDESRSIIVLYEEPELYIHPHLMRRLKSVLVSRSEQNGFQVICSTHSPFLVDIGNNPESLKLMRKDQNGDRTITEVTSQIFEENDDYNERNHLRAALDFHPSVAESFFAKRALIVEGDTELAVFSLAKELADKLGVDIPLYKDTTVVSAGGKWTIPAILKTLNGLGVDFRVVHDKDQKEKRDDELDQLHHLHPYRANTKIKEQCGRCEPFVINDTFEHILWDQMENEIAPSSDKPYNSWSRVRNFLEGHIDLTQRSKNELVNLLGYSFS